MCFLLTLSREIKKLSSQHADTQISHGNIDVYTFVSQSVSIVLILYYMAMLSLYTRFPRCLCWCVCLCSGAKRRRGGFALHLLIGRVSPICWHRTECLLAHSSNNETWFVLAIQGTESDERRRSTCYSRLCWTNAFFVRGCKYPTLLYFIWQVSGATAHDSPVLSLFTLLHYSQTDASTYLS